MGDSGVASAHADHPLRVAQAWETVAPWSGMADSGYGQHLAASMPRKYGAIHGVPCIRSCGCGVNGLPLQPYVWSDRLLRGHGVYCIRLRSWNPSRCDHEILWREWSRPAADGGGKVAAWRRGCGFLASPFCSA